MTAIAPHRPASEPMPPSRRATPHGREPRTGGTPSFGSACLRGLTWVCGVAAAAQGLSYASATARLAPTPAPPPRDPMASTVTPWYYAALAPAPSFSELTRRYAGLLGDSPALSPAQMAAEEAAGRAFDALLDVVDDDAPDQTAACGVTVDDLAAVEPHTFSRRHVRLQLHDASVQPYAAINGLKVKWAPVPPGTQLYSARYGGAPNILDIRQGVHSGDCALLAEMAPLAARYPSFLKSSIVPVDDPTMPANVTHYRVRTFVRDSETRTNLPVWVDIDDQLPYDRLGRIAAFTYDFLNRTDTFLWPALLEKAVAKLQQSFQANWEIDLTGYAALSSGALHQYRAILTGQPAMFLGITVIDTLNVAEKNARMLSDRFDTMYAMIQDPRVQTSVTLAGFDDLKYVVDGRGISYVHPGYCDLTSRITWADGMTIKEVDSFTMWMYSADGRRVLPLLAEHMYSVVGANESAVFLYNPWGFNGRAITEEIAASRADATALFPPPAAAPGLPPTPAPLPSVNQTAFAQGAAFGPATSARAPSRVWRDPVLVLSRGELGRIIGGIEVGYGPSEPEDLAPIPASVHSRWGTSRTADDYRLDDGRGSRVPTPAPAYAGARRHA